MKQDLIQKLREKYPSLYNSPVSSREGLTNFDGIGDGWFDLINSLSDEIVAYFWSGGRDVGDTELLKFDAVYGTLTVYAICDINVNRILLKYQDLSRDICDECGKKGTYSKSHIGWLSIKCNEHETIRL